MTYLRKAAKDLWRHLANVDKLRGAIGVREENSSTEKKSSWPFLVSGLSCFQAIIAKSKYVRKNLSVTFAHWRDKGV